MTWRYDHKFGSHTSKTISKKRKVAKYKYKTKSKSSHIYNIDIDRLIDSLYYPQWKFVFSVSTGPHRHKYTQ